MEKAHRLIQRILAGDTEEFRELVQTYERLVLHVIAPMISEPSEREDICQDVFIKVYQNLSRFKFQSSLATWIGRIAYNTGVNFLRKKKLPLYEDFRKAEQVESDGDEIIRLFSSEDPDPGQEMEANDRTQFIMKQINLLPVPYKSIIILYHLEQLSYQEIADIMDMPEGTVKSYLFRGRKKLKEMLTGEFAGEIR